MTLKAYYVTPLDQYQDNTEPYADVVHAKTRGQAKAKAWFYREGDLDFTQIKATRLPAMDGREITDRNLVTYAGFYCYCRGCHALAEGPDGGDPWFDEQGRAFCWRCFQGLNGVQDAT